MSPNSNVDYEDLINYIQNFSQTNPYSLFPESVEGKISSIDNINISSHSIIRYTNEFWTSKQRQSSSLHEISYRACYKAQLPNFIIRLLTQEGDIVYDPYSGRGTTLIEAGLMNRRTISNDVNPISRILLEPRLNIPEISNVEHRLNGIKDYKSKTCEIDLSMFTIPKLYLN